jgi:hypothetical protein
MPTDNSFEGLVAHLKQRSKRLRYLSLLLFLIPLVLAVVAGLRARRQTHADWARMDQTDTLVSMYDSILRVYVKRDSVAQATPPEAPNVLLVAPLHPSPKPVVQPEPRPETRATTTRVALDSAREAVKSDKLPDAIRHLRQVRSSLAVPSKR